MQQLKLFCKNPTLKNYDIIDLEIKKKLKQKSKYCIENNVGNTQLADKCIDFYDIVKLNEKQKKD